MNDDSYVLVTGAGGYLGGRVMETLEKRNVPAIGLGRSLKPHVTTVVDMLDRDALTAVLADIAPGSVIHTAAMVPTALDGYGDEDAAQASVTMAHNLATALSAGVTFVLVSSMTVYGPTSGHVAEDAALAPASAYGRGKVEAERVCAACHGYAVRIPGLYGAPRETGLMNKLRTALREGETPHLPKEPLQWAAMPVDDAASAIVDLALLEPADALLPVNVGPAGPISIDRLATLATHASDREAPPPLGHPDFEYDLTRWQDLTGIEPKRFDNNVREWIT